MSLAENRAAQKNVRLKYINLAMCNASISVLLSHRLGDNTDNIFK